MLCLKVPFMKIKIWWNYCLVHYISQIPLKKILSPLRLTYAFSKFSCRYINNCEFQGIEENMFINYFKSPSKDSHGSKENYKNPKPVSSQDVNFVHPICQMFWYWINLLKIFLLKFEIKLSSSHLTSQSGWQFFAYLKWNTLIYSCTRNFMSNGLLTKN